MKHNMLLLCALAILCACAEKPAEETGNTLADPTSLEAEQLDLTTVKFEWADNAQGEIGYRVFLRAESDAYHVSPLATIEADATSYTFENLTTGALYDFGVQAISDDMKKHSQTVWINDFKVIDLEALPIITNVETSFAYIAVSYKAQKITGSNPEHGICFSESGLPTVDDIMVKGPAISVNEEILQVVPNAYLEADKEYTMRVCIKSGDDWNYSEPQTVRLDAQPGAPGLVWEKQTYEGLPADVEIYKTVSQLDGRNLNAWYAIADPTKVDFRVLYPEAVGAKKTVSAQAEAEDDCLVLINGAIFGNYNIGVIITEGTMTQQWHGEIEGCHWASNSSLYQITRPIIGVDKDGKPGAYWVGVPEQGTFHYYDRPQPSVVGQAKYDKVSATSPVAEASWEPYYAISCGPMVVYDGKVSADNTKVDGDHYYTNYACWAESSIYAGNPDRSAVGVTEDGKIVLFICDGRIDQSQGATMTELGRIMKEIGCKYAMNLDGGGSTGMWVDGSDMINYKDGSWRAVKSTLGFFSNK